MGQCCSCLQGFLHGYEHINDERDEIKPLPPKTGHPKRLRPREGSYSESVIRDIERLNIPTEFAKLYDIGELIGLGTTSKVYLCWRRAQPEEKFACKVIDKRRLNMGYENKEMLLAQLRKEIDILRTISHPNIVRFHNVVETRDQLYIVMEMLSGGELFNYVLDNGPLADRQARCVMKDVMTAVAYLHDRGIIHRDIKAENLLISHTNGDDIHVKLIDFGFSTILKYDMTGSFLGTGGYIAPEIRQQRSYSQSVDMWACGVLLYVLLSGRLPFSPSIDTLPCKRQEVQSSLHLKFPEKHWRHVSDSAKHLVSRMLDVDPMSRYSAKQVLRHPWMKGSTDAILRSPEMSRISSIRSIPIKRPNLHGPATAALKPPDPYRAAVSTSLTIPIHSIVRPTGGHDVDDFTTASLTATDSDATCEAIDNDTGSGSGPLRSSKSCLELEKRWRSPASTLTPALTSSMDDYESNGHGGEDSRDDFQHDENKDDVGASEECKDSVAATGSGSSAADGHGSEHLWARTQSYCPQVLHNAVAGDLATTSIQSYQRYSTTAPDDGAYVRNAYGLM